MSMNAGKLQVKKTGLDCRNEPFEYDFSPNEGMFVHPLDIKRLL